MKRTYSARAVRVALDISVPQLAKMLRVTFDCAHSWDNGRRKPNQLNQAIINRIGRILDGSPYVQRNKDTFAKDLLSQSTMEDFLSYVFTVDINRP